MISIVPKSMSEHASASEIHQKIGILTRQLHDSLNELGYTDRLKGTVEKLPDAKSRLSYIARLTGEAAEKVLSRVEQGKSSNDFIAAEANRVCDLLVRDPVAAVAKGHVFNFVKDVEKTSEEVDGHLTEIMMAQDFHDLTGQVIARVVALTSTIEEQLVELLIQTAPDTPATAAAAAAAAAAKSLDLTGPVINPEGNPDVVSSQSQVDDLLASLGF